MPVDDRATKAALDALMVRIGAAGAVAVKGAGLLVQGLGMARTPVLSGTLRRSWHTEPLPAPMGVYAVRVGPTMVYARRIELGFKGADSLGRVYAQAPDPYVKPTLEEARPRIRALVVSTIAKAIRG
jgi:hypothetical protein